jgi:N utilization substance protein B
LKVALKQLEMDIRHQNRIRAVQVLFAVDLGRSEPRMLLDDLQNGEWDLEGDCDCAAVAESVLGVLSNLEEIDKKLNLISRKWKVSRMGATDRAILRLAAFEMLFSRTNPLAVIIDEAVELAHEFGDTKSSDFINALLDSLAQQEQLIAVKETGK